jgi:predicted site-specific integrase-resolvase
MAQHQQHRYLSGKAAREILDVSDNTLRRWANNGTINYIRNSEKGKRYYDIYAIINENKNINKKTTLANHTKRLPTADSEGNLSKLESKVPHINKLEKQYNIIDKPLSKIPTSMDDTTIDYSNIDFSMYTKKKMSDENLIYCYCKVNKKTQQEYLDKQVDKLKQLYTNSEIISCVSTNDLNWKKNNIIKLISVMKEKKVKELIINKSEFISDKLIELITELCTLYEINVIKI